MDIKNKKNKEVRIDQQEWLVLQISLHIDKLMEQQNVNRVELARRLGTGKSYVTQLLDGSNMTLRKVADVMMALDSSLTVDTVSQGFETTIKLVEHKTDEVASLRWNWHKHAVDSDVFEESIKVSGNLRLTG